MHGENCTDNRRRGTWLERPPPQAASTCGCWTSIRGGQRHRAGRPRPLGHRVVDLFRGVDVVVHLAADATAQQTWPK